MAQDVPPCSCACVGTTCRAIGAQFSSRRPPAALRSIDGAARLRTVPCGEGGRSWREFDRSFEGNRWRRMCLRAAVHALTPRVAPLAPTSPREGRRQPSARSTAPPAFARCHAARADALGGSSTGASRATNGAGCASVQLCMCIALETSSHLRNNDYGRMAQCAAEYTSRRLSAISGLLASACACAA